MSAGALIVIAKEPRAGRSKTRLCPPCSPAEAAALAEAALADTLAAVAQTPCARRVVALDGRPGDWLPPGFEVIPQRGGGLAQRLAGAFADCGGPAFLVAMDTPQLTPEGLAGGLEPLCRGAGASLGLTFDGGYWGIGLARADARVFEGVPMSSTRTAARQSARLRALRLGTVALPRLRDVDDIGDARAVAALAPHTRFAQQLRRSGHAADQQQAVAEAAA